MPISDKDREFMEEVAEYFRSTIDSDNKGSIRDTALKFNLTRTKVQKILITTGDYETPQTQEIQKLREQGLSVNEIADHFNISPATVSSCLPYTDTFHGTAEPSKKTAAMREYRAYEKLQAKRQEQKKEERDDWRKDLDSKLSFTTSDSRRPRITYEMLEESGMIEKTKDILDSSGINFTYDRESEREALRKKQKEGAPLSPTEILDLGEFPGALYDRNALALKELYGEPLPYEPREMIRLHLELDCWFTEDELETMHQYGKLDGKSISRDILVSDDLPLYALHYVIQRAFGWQNSHLHRFYLPDEKVEQLTESVEQWMEQIGVIFRSPLMNEYSEFWADDYKGGSFKNWLRKKYTGPCVSQCWEEGLIGARSSMMDFDLDREYYVEFGNYRDGEAKPLRCRPVYSWDGKKLDPPKADQYVHRVEVMKVRDIPVPLLNQMFERGAFDILERLSIGEVLAVHNMHCSDEFSEGEYASTYQEMLDDGMDYEIDEILKTGVDSPMKQPYVYSFTDELLYQYDFGDNWQVSITGSRNCTDLVESGRITQDMLDKSNIKARVTYRPVLLARDGEMMIDDVGGTSGFVSFIRAINTMRRGERDENGMTRAELIKWAKSQGWHKDDSSDFRLL